MNKNVKQTIETVNAASTIFDDVQEARTLIEALNLMDGCVTVESTRPLLVSKIYNEFKWYTYMTKEIKGKFGTINMSEEILVLKEEEVDEDIDSISAVFEIPIEDIESFEYEELNNILLIHLNNGMDVKVYS